MTQIVLVEGTRYTLILDRVVRFRIPDRPFHANGLVDAQLLWRVEGLGGYQYAIATNFFSMLLPKL